MDQIAKFTLLGGGIGLSTFALMLDSAFAYKKVIIASNIELEWHVLDQNQLRTSTYSLKTVVYKGIFPSYCFLANEDNTKIRFGTSLLEDQQEFYVVMTEDATNPKIVGLVGENGKLVPVPSNLNLKPTQEGMKIIIVNGETNNKIRLSKSGVIGEVLGLPVADSTKKSIFQGAECEFNKVQATNGTNRVLLSRISTIIQHTPTYFLADEKGKIISLRNSTAYLEVDSNGLPYALVNSKHLSSVEYFYETIYNYKNVRIECHGGQWHVVYDSDDGRRGLTFSDESTNTILSYQLLS